MIITALKQLSEWLHTIRETYTPFQIFIVSWAIIVVIQSLWPKKKKKQAKTNDIENTYKAMALIAQHPYEKLNVMSPRHLEHYRRLKAYADRNNLIVCPKVHMGSLLLPERDSYETQKLKRLTDNFVDFVLCTQDMTVVKVIMIKSDDSDLEKALTEFYTKMFTDAGHSIVFTREITDDILRF